MSEKVWEIKPAAARAAYTVADPNTKKVFETLFGKEKFQIDWKTITTLEQVCEIAGEDINDYVIPEGASIRKRGVILFSILQLVCEVFRAGVVMDFSDNKQQKHYPWMEYHAGSGFRFCASSCDPTNTFVSARLSVDSEDKVKHIVTHFGKYYDEYLRWC